MIKILVNISGDKKLHFSWQAKEWNSEISNGLNIKDRDTQNDSNQGDFPTQSYKEYLGRNRKWKSVITQLMKTVVTDNPKNNMSVSIWNILVLLQQGVCISLWDFEISNKPLINLQTFLHCSKLKM
jgi:hypothetical protein